MRTDVCAQKVEGMDLGVRACQCVASSLPARPELAEINLAQSLLNYLCDCSSVLIESEKKCGTYFHNCCTFSEVTVWELIMCI